MSMPPLPLADTRLLVGPLAQLAVAPVPTVAADATVFDAAWLLTSRRAGFVAVVDADRRPLGVVTEARLLQQLRGTPPAGQRVDAVMEPPVCVDGQLDAGAGLQRCLDGGGVPLLLVDAEGRLAAAVTENDFRARLHLCLLAGRHTVASVMAQAVRPLAPGDPLALAIARMGDVDASATVVVDGELPVGVLTSRDVARLVAEQVDPVTVRLADVMSRPVQTVPLRATLAEAADRMLSAGTRHLVVVDDAGRLVGVLDEHSLTRSMAHDLLSAGIEQERARQRAVLQHIPDLIWLKDPDGVYLSCNPRFQRLYGASEAQILGHTDFDFVPRETAEFFRQMDVRAIQHDGPSVNEELLRYADGHEELVQTIKTPVRDDRGRLLGVLGIGRDITALRRTEDEYRLLFERNPAPMMVYVRDTLAIVRVNEAFTALYGWTVDEATRLSVTDLYLEEDRPVVSRRVPRMRGLVKAGQWRHRRSDGQVIHVVTQSHDTLHDGRDARVATITDVTALTRAQQRDRQRMEVMERLARGDAVEPTLERLVRHHEELFPDSLCSVVLLDPTGGHMQHAAAPSLPQEYCRAIDGLAIGPEVGSCGAALYTGQPAVAEDIQQHPHWAPYRVLAARAGLRACWSQPILGSGGRVLGSFAVYRREPGRPGPEEQEHMMFAVQLAATVIDHASTARALHESQSRLNTVLQALPDMVWLKDAAGVYRMCNAAFARRRGRDVDQLIGLRDSDLYTAEESEHRRLQDQQVLATGQPVTEERWLTLAGGERRLVEIIKAPLYDEQRRVTGVLGVGRDITLVKQGASAVAEQERLIDTMLGQVTESVALIDPATHRFVTFNEATCTGLGYTRQQFQALTPADLRTDHDPAKVDALMARALQEPVVRFDTRHVDAQGQLHDVAVTLRPVDYRGRRLVSAVWRDITEDKRAQARLQRLTRSYALLSGVNEAVVRLRDRAELFTEVCRIAVEAGAFSQAWIGAARNGEVRPLAWAGAGIDHLHALRIPLDSALKAPVARAYASGQPVTVTDVTTEPALRFRRDEMVRLGQRAMAVFPLIAGGTPWHALVVYSESGEHFDDEQVALLSRLARDLVHALQFIEAERKQEEAQRFREQLIESVAGLFFAIDQAGRLVLWNRRLEEVSGRSAADLEGVTAISFFDGEDFARVREAVRIGFEDGETQVEAHMITRDNTRTPHLFVGRRVQTQGGTLLVGTGIDISDRVRSERELARYREQLEHLVQQRTAELEAVNARLHREDRRLRAMLDLSQQASQLSEDEIFRLGMAEIVALTGSSGGCVRSVVAGADGQGLQLRGWTGSEEPPPEAFAMVVARTGLACIADASATREMGCDKIGVQQAIGAPVLEDGRPVLVVCAFNKADPYDEADQRELELLASDLWQVVQRRRIELALVEAKAAADAASQAKSAFLANMSHEIRTPMNAVIGFAHLLTRDPLTPRQRDHLSKITDASQHLMQVINDILDFSKIEAHKITLEDEDFVLQDSLARVQAMQADAARAKRLPVTLHVDPGVPAVLRGDRLRLEQILLNLLSNAVKFTLRGRIEVRVSLHGSADDPEPLLRMAVSDSGIGMTPEQLSHVFEAFAQADVSTTRRFGGTGLGLAISKRLVQLMQGRIGADSQPGQGSTFWIELPLRRGTPLAVAPQAPADTAPREPARLKGVRILVVEDNPINQEVTSTLLSTLGASVQLAASGEEALRVFDATAHDLILMDVQMPGMDGLRATAAIRQRSGGAQVPIVAMTANAFAEDRAQCLAAGMNDYLAKPVEPQALEQCLLRWLRKAPSPAATLAAESEGALRQRLEAIDSLDTVGPLSRMRGAWPLYLRMLRMFVNHHAADADRLQALADDDIAGLRALVHSISGAAATVGATDVVRQAQALHAQVTSGDGARAVASWRRPLADALRRFLADVSAALDPAATDVPVAPAPAATADAARALLDQLAPLLAANDTAALGLFERHAAQLESVYGDSARELGRPLREFNFSAAQAVLAQMRAAVAQAS